VRLFSYVWVMSRLRTREELVRLRVVVRVGAMIRVRVIAHTGRRSHDMWGGGGRHSTEYTLV